MLLLALCAYILVGVPVVPFHGDESTYSFMSRDYAYQFLQGDLSRVTYRQPPVSEIEQLLRLINGSVSKYTMGLAWHLAGFSLDDLNGDWIWAQTYETNVSQRARAAPALLAVERLPSALFTCLGVLAMFGLACAVGGRGAAWAAAILFAFHPVILMNGRRAVAEGAMMAFTLLSVLAAVWVIRLQRWTGEPSARKRAEHLCVWISFAVCAGLALASKHTTLLTVGILSLGILLLGLPAPHGRRSLFWWNTAKQTIRLILAGILAFAVFYLLNPIWWGDPFTRVIEVVKQRSFLMSVQVSTATPYSNRWEQIAGFSAYTSGWQPQYFESDSFAGSIQGEISRYEASGLAGVLLPGVVPAALFASLSALGSLSLLVSRARPDQAGTRALRPHIRSRVLVLVWAVAVLGSTAFLTAVSWQRYYLPAILGACLLAGIGVDTVLRVGIGLAARLSGQSRSWRRYIARKPYVTE